MLKAVLESPITTIIFFTVAEAGLRATYSMRNAMVVAPLITVVSAFRRTVNTGSVRLQADCDSGTITPSRNRTIRVA